jgi:hypothetical protein
MLVSFWQRLGEGLAGEWSARTLTPAFAFWGGALLAYNQRYGWDGFRQFLNQVEPVLGVTILVGLLFLLTVSTMLVQWLTLPLLRLIEGYWLWPFRELRVRLIDRLNRTLVEKENQLGKLADKYEARTASLLEAEKYARLETELDQYPLDPNLRLPTRVGNILRTAEEYPWRCYGLEITTTWPRLWLALPESVQEELNTAREAMDQIVQLFIWGAAFMIWTIWVWWALPIGLSVAVIAYLRIPALADVYGQLLRAVYDLYRFALFEGVHWPLPSDPETERQLGEALTTYLKSNIAPHNLPPDNSKLFFRHPGKE